VQAVTGHGPTISNRWTVTAERPVNSIFEQGWRLDAVAPGSWDTVEVRSADATLEACLPYTVRFDGRGMKVIDMPPLTVAPGSLNQPRPTNVEPLAARWRCSASWSTSCLRPTYSGKASTIRSRRACPSFSVASVSRGSTPTVLVS